MTVPGPASNLRIVVVAINPAGTLGHATSASAIVETLLAVEGDRPRVAVIADDTILPFVGGGDVIAVTRSSDERSDGGALSYSYTPELTPQILGLCPDIVVFDTFFASDAVRALREANVATVLVSYRFRDTAMEIFRTQWLEFFSRCFWLLEPFESAAEIGTIGMGQEISLPPLSRPKAVPPARVDERYVLLTRGGGGQPGTQRAFVRVMECLASESALTPIVVNSPSGTAVEFEQTGKSRVLDHLGRLEFLSLLRSAELVVSEAGFNTCLELACVGQRALLVPGPRRTDNQELRAVRMSALPGFSYVLPEHTHKITEEFIHHCIHSSETIRPLDAQASCGPQLFRSILYGEVT